MTAHPPRVLAEAGFCDPRALPKGPNGRNFCRRCSSECPKKQQTFCSPECVNDWRIRSNPGYARQKVFERDGGVCAICKADCGGVQRVPGGKVRGGAFDVDHIVAVAEGGGSCGLENLRTLCRPCHVRMTAELKARLAARRKESA